MTQLLISGVSKIPNNYISRIRISKLFGDLSYDLILSASTGKRLGIMSGSNGSGKTTILRLIDSALAASPGARKVQTHQVIFENFEITLENGMRIGFRRPEATNGPFSYYILYADGHEDSIVFETPKNREHLELETAEYVADPGEEHTYKSMATALRQAPRSIYLPTERDAGYTLDHPTSYRIGSRENLRKSIEDFTSRLQVRARKGSNDAEILAYDILDRTVRRAMSDEQPEYNREELLRIIAAQFQRVKDYAEVGLMSVVDPTTLVKTIETVPDENLRSIAAVVFPYIESQKARLDSLQETSELILELVKSLNAFFNRKQIKLDLVSGLSIFKNGTKLAVHALSSGERQLLLLTTKACARERSIVIIDEPELSLNSDWTRKLLRHLLDPRLTGNTQFLIATHSIEFQAQYPDSVLDLSSGEPLTT